MRNVVLLELSTTVNVVRSTKHSIHLLKTDLLSFRYKEPDEGSQQDVDTSKHIEGVESLVLEEEREELLDDRVGDVLGLRAHADGLGADVHGEDFGGVDPDGGTP